MFGRAKKPRSIRPLGPPMPGLSPCKAPLPTCEGAHWPSKMAAMGRRSAIRRSRAGVNRRSDVTGWYRELGRPSGRRCRHPACGLNRMSHMSTRLGNSGRGTDGPAPSMSREERQKSAVASGEGGKRDGETGPRPEDLDRGHRKSAELDHQAEPNRQPGGGRHSESEKPNSSKSRWGGGR
jgi:hypothetical protein